MFTVPLLFSAFSVRLQLAVTQWLVPIEAASSDSARQLPKDVTHVEDVEAVVQDILTLYYKLNKYGVTRPDDAADQRALVFDLNQKQNISNILRKYHNGSFVSRFLMLVI